MRILSVPIVYLALLIVGIVGASHWANTVKENAQLQRSLHQLTVERYALIEAAR